jgi:hypothetical protein
MAHKTNQDTLQTTAATNMVSIQLSFESHPREEFTLNVGNDIQDCIDMILAMKKQETAYTSSDYLIQDNLDVDESSRSKMVQWCYQTVDFFKLSRNSVSIGMSCLDRFLSTPEGQPFLMDKTLYQLACITSLYVAIKVHEPVELGVSMLVQLCRGVYTAEQILETEQTMLQAIQWAVNPPSPKSFIQCFVAMLPRGVSVDTRRDLLDLAVYQTELALAEYRTGSQSLPSVVAFGSIVNALAFCPEINHRVTGQYFRTLGKATGCTRYMDSLIDVKNVMANQMQIVRVSISSETQTVQKSSIPCHSRERRSSCAVRAKTFEARLRQQHMSPVAVNLDESTHDI